MTKVQDQQHYEVVLFHDSNDYDKIYERYEYVVADSAKAAKVLGRQLCLEGEVVESARKISHVEVAVMMLNGAKLREDAP